MDLSDLLNKMSRSSEFIHFVSIWEFLQGSDTFINKWAPSRNRTNTEAGHGIILLSHRPGDWEGQGGY